MPPPKTLQLGYAQGSTVVLGGGRTAASAEVDTYRGTALIRKRPPPKTLQQGFALGPYGGSRGWAAGASADVNTSTTRFRPPALGLYRSISLIRNAAP